MECTDKLSLSPTASLLLTGSRSSWMSTLSSLSLMFGEPAELLVLAELLSQTSKLTDGINNRFITLKKP